MIGNTILFKNYNGNGYGYEALKGIVVDSFTSISGYTTGSVGGLLGFVDGKIKGDTKSNRMYKVEYYAKRDYQNKEKLYKDVYAEDLIEILSFAGNSTHEINEEKIVIK